MNLVQDCTLVFGQETQGFYFIISSKPDLVGRNLEILLNDLVKRLGICMAVAFQAEDLNGYADRDALYFGAAPFHPRGDMGDMLAQVDDSASQVLPASQG